MTLLETYAKRLSVSDSVYSKAHERWNFKYYKENGSCHGLKQY